MSAIVGTPESEVNGNRSHELPGLLTKTEMTQPRHIPAACSLSFFSSMVMDIKRFRVLWDGFDRYLECWAFKD